MKEFFSSKCAGLRFVFLYSMLTGALLQTHTLKSQERRDDITQGLRGVRTATAVMTGSEAVERAAAQIGLKKSDGDRATTERARLSHESLPFLTPQLSGVETWRITFRDLVLRESGGDAKLNNAYIKRLVVFLAPDTGHVLKVTSIWPKSVPRIAPFPACAEEERQMKASGRSYDGLPREAPTVSLMEAVIAKNTSGWSKEVKQIHACYVLESSVRYEAKPVWVVQFRGPLQWQPHPPKGIEVEAELDAYNHIRNVIDARTGKWLGASSIPQPVADLEDRY